MSNKEKTVVAFVCPVQMKLALQDEAARRGLTVSGFLKMYLSNFLRENIDLSIIGNEKAETR